MNVTQAQFYLDVIRVYNEKGVPEERIDKLFNVIFIELSLVDADDLSREHTQLMDKAQLHFASIEDFKRADLIKKTKEIAFQIFKARDEHLKFLQEKLDEKLKKKKDDDN
jgi:hypothetical protein